MIIDRLLTYIAAQLGVRPGERQPVTRLAEKSNREIDAYFKENPTH